MVATAFLLLPFLLGCGALNPEDLVGHRSCDDPQGHKNNSQGDHHPLVVHYVSEPGLAHPGYQNFLLSLNLFGWMGAANVGETDREWKNAESNKHWAARTRSYLRYAEDQDPDRVLIFADVFDVLFMESPAKFLRKFREIGRRVVFAAERFCDTEACRKAEGGKEGMDRLAPEGNPYRYLNAGMMAAKAKDAVPFLKEVAQYMEENNVDDQAAAVHTMLSLGNRHDVTLDYSSALFGVISPALEHYYKDWTTKLVASFDLGVVMRKKSKARPTALHFAGMRYENNPDQRFNPCQRFQMLTYNSILSKFMSLQVLHSKLPRVVVSLSADVNSVMSLTESLESLLAQTFTPAAIYVNIPEHVRVPSYLKGFPLVKINRFATDYGEAASALAILGVEQNSSTLIFTADPRFTYEEHALQVLISQHRAAPHAVYGYDGYIIPENGDVHAVADFRNIPSIVGVDMLSPAAALYQRSVFSSFPSPPDAVPPECRLSGHAWIAAQLAQQSVPFISLQRKKLTSVSLRPNGPSVNFDLLASCTRKFSHMFRRLPSPKPCVVSFVLMQGLDTPQVGGRAPWWTPNSTVAPCNLTPPRNTTA